MNYNIEAIFGYGHYACHYESILFLMARGVGEEIKKAASVKEMSYRWFNIYPSDRLISENLEKALG